jgi:uncharacterized protein YdeI (YjbR/CyaY-like superfamily)
MAKRDPRIDAYIAKAAPFARPILSHLRELLHEYCPDLTEEFKWSRPHFDYHGPMCGMGAFKNHASFGFWKWRLLKDPTNQLRPISEDGMGNFGKLTSLEDLPSEKTIGSLIRQAAKLNEEGIKATPGVRKPKPPLKTPPYLTSALKKNKKAGETFESFSPSHRREYIEWLTEAKSEETREKRLATTIEWLTEGKARNWKYERK